MKSLTRVRSLVVLSALLAVLLVASAPSSTAQCFGPDNLDVGACCQATLPILPQFPNAALPGLGICWNACAVAGTTNLRVDWPAPAQPVCGEYSTLLTVSNAATGLPILTGTLVLDYTRTWIEVDPTGGSHQVWRFAAKADLSFATVGVPAICPSPPCLTPIGPHQTAFFYGYVDYTTCNAASPWENTLVLYHACDRFIHAPGLSDKPGVFHPGGAYAIVAPHSPLQPFVPMNLVASGGPLVAEAMRNVNGTAVPPTVCFVEDKVVSGAMSPLGAGCICNFSTFPKHQTARKFSGTTACTNAAGVPGGWASLDILFPTLPWMHLVSSSIGCWSNPAVYPGKECAWADEGLFVHQDPCNGDYIELKYGGTTRDGWFTLPMPAVVKNCTDLADNYTAPLTGPYPTPILGSIRPTDHLIYVNEP